MTQSYVEINEASALPRQRTEQRLAAREVVVPQIAPPEAVATRRFVVALWSSVLLFTMGVVFIYHSSSQERGLLFMSGMVSVVASIALFLRARSSLLARFEREFRAQDMSEVAAKHHARVRFDDVLGARKSALPDRKADHVIERFPLA